MHAILLEKVGNPLVLSQLPKPKPKQGEVLIQVQACTLCRTDLHIIEGELTPPRLPLILGHQVVGRIVELGKNVRSLKKGDRVGVPWLGKSCGKCFYCEQGQENLCDEAKFTGFDLQGGLAEYCVADASFVFSLPESYTDEEAAPLLCAGMIGYRSLKMTGHAKKVGFYGFGASAHLLTQLATFQKRLIYAFTRKGDTRGQSRAIELGARWAGDSETECPDLLDAAIIFAPVGSLIPVALRALRKGGEVICAGIHMSDIPSFPYSILWGERAVRSIANLTRQDGKEFLTLAAQVPIKPEITIYPLEKTNDAFDDLRKGKISGSAVVKF